MKLPREPKAVVFDMDGLIFDTERLNREAFVAAAASAGHEMSNDFHLMTVGLPGATTSALLTEHYGSSFDTIAFWNSVSQRFRDLSKTDLCLKTGVVELLDVLDKRQLPKAIATSSRHETANHHLAEFGIRQRFDTVVASGDYVRGKPHPDPYLVASERLGVSPERCIALEDSYNGIRAAHAAGMMTIMAPDLLPSTLEMEGLCAAVAENLHEVSAFLQQ